jgi:hypothetical protein
MRRLPVCACCGREVFGEVEAVGDEGAEFFNCKPEDFVCFWCWVGVNQEPGDPFPWPWMGRA